MIEKNLINNDKCITSTFSVQNSLKTLVRKFTLYNKIYKIYLLKNKGIKWNFLEQIKIKRREF